MQVKDVIEELKRYDPTAEVEIRIWMLTTHVDRAVDGVKLNAGKVVIESE